MSSLAAYYRQAFTAHEAVPVEAPWPFGDKKAVLWVRPDYVSPFVDAIAAAGVAPPETIVRRIEMRSESLAADRAKAAKDAKRTLLSKGRGAQYGAMEPVIDMLDGMAAAAENGLPPTSELVSEGWDIRYPVYLREEVEAAASLVGLHLIAKAGLVPGAWAEADGEADLEPWSAEEIAALFAEQEPLPAVYPDPDRQNETVPFSGVPERVAWATICLRVAVQRHLYLERAVPLDSGSPVAAPSLVTQSESETSLPDLLPS